ncbi:MAG: DUF6090 family protein [Saprospiraceae bacterium]
MIKLFRNIRQSLLAEGKTTKYLKYATGEIILVVIGILIALQINNWNSENFIHINNYLIFYVNKTLFFVFIKTSYKHFTFIKIQIICSLKSYLFFASYLFSAADQ